ncbi:hypothetical protein [Phytoactinopolyspora mesophila]|uniref:Uncharacterized protein n=1 Tax=Phytoactinopolyspora mesophila TaxID=2650750 RepID=A0A7K3MA06_9ACTN|nr:hypothetical protein [Phytoactinopolyspora mesophila]NDL60155.1 hypothetical protein [Phytoactinopolyspora mesophila]
MQHNPPAYTFTSTATRDGVFWMVQCDQYPSVRSKVRLLAQGVRHQRYAIAALLGVPEARISVDVRPILPACAEKHMARARELRADAARANRAAAEESRAAARALAEAQLSLRDIGTVLGISFQRAHQLINS